MTVRNLEPVAYISHTSEGDILGWERQFDAPSHTPLYAAPQPAVQGEPVGYVSQDFLDGKWSLDHIAKSDEGQISRTIPVFAKPPAASRAAARRICTGGGA